jgi:hypothetical protein
MQRAAINQLSSDIALPNRSRIVQCRRTSQNIVALVPRGGIELSPIGLKLRDFSNHDFLVYPLMYPAFRTLWQRQKPFV